MINLGLILNSGGVIHILVTYNRENIKTRGRFIPAWYTEAGDAYLFSTWNPERYSSPVVMTVPSFSAVIAMLDNFLFLQELASVYVCCGTNYEHEYIAPPNAAAGLRNPAGFFFLRIASFFFCNQMWMGHVQVSSVFCLDPKLRTKQASRPQCLSPSSRESEKWRENLKQGTFDPKFQRHSKQLQEKRTEESWKLKTGWVPLQISLGAICCGWTSNEMMKKKFSPAWK